MATMKEGEKNWDCAISGKRGDGKSFMAMELALILDPTFNIKRVAFGIDEFLKLVEELPPRKFVVADEIGQWFGSRDFMKEKNKDLSDLLQIFRICQLGVIYTLPAMYQVDKNLRTMSDVYIKAIGVQRNHNMSVAKYFNIEMDPVRGKKIYIKHPVVRGLDGFKKKVTRVWFDRIPWGLEMAYRRKKKAFTKRIIAEKREAANTRREKKTYKGKPPNTTCKKCGYKWFYKGMRKIANCPSCNNKTSSSV